MFKGINHSNYSKIDRCYHYQLIEQYESYFQFNNGMDTKKNIKLHGSANLDASDSTGQLILPTGGISGNIQGGKQPVINPSGATLTLTAAQSGSIVTLNAATGVTITLPAPVIGLNYTFTVTTSVTSNNHKVITDAGTTLILGGVVMTEASDTNAGLAALFNGTTHIAILMNGTTTGGLIGTTFNMYCVTATQWNIEGIVAGSGTLATCASTS